MIRNNGYFLILIIFLFLVTIFLPDKVYAQGYDGPWALITSGCSAGAVWTGEVDGARFWDTCSEGYFCEYEWAAPSGVSSVEWFIDGISYGTPSTQTPIEEGDDCTCDNVDTGGQPCVWVCEGVPETWFVSDTIPAGLPAGDHTLRLRVESVGRSHEATCTFTIEAACVCTANSNWCEGNYAWHCSSDCLSKWSEDCGYWEDYTNNYRCNGTTLQREYVSRGCSGGACYWNSSWWNWQECGLDNCSDSGSSWYIKESVQDNNTCVGDACVADQTYWDYCDSNINHDRQCSGTNLGADATKNCNDFDGVYGGEYRDYSCSDGACVYSVVNRPPNVPDYVTGYPPNGSWINYTPSFRVTVSDPDTADTVRAEFTVSCYGTYLVPTYVANPGISEWPLVNVSDTSDCWWQARAQDNNSSWSVPSGWWLLRKDTINPTATLDQENGTSTDTSIWVNLNEFDERSLINQGDVDMRINSPLATATIEQLGNQLSARSGPCPIDSGTMVGDCAAAWYEYVFNFPANGTYNAGAETSNTGELRDQGISHNVNVYIDGVLKGTFINPASDPAIQLGWVSLGNVSAGNHTIRYEWTNDWCGACSGGRGDSNIKIHKVWIDDWSDYATTIDNFTYTGVNGSKYEFRYRIRDNANNWSNFSYDGSVTVNINQSPTASNFNATPSDFCASNVIYSFSWIYSDPDGDTESRFEFQVDNNSGFSSPEVSRDFAGLSNPSPSTNTQSVLLVPPPPPADCITYGMTYYWRVRVWDSNGTDSGWLPQPPLVITAIHRYPICNFTWLPKYPNPDEDVQFIDTSVCYDDNPDGSDCSSAAGDTFLWTINNGNPGSSILENPISVFSSFGNTNVILRVTDSDGYWCENTEQIRINFPLPSWKEIKP